MAEYIEREAATNVACNILWKNNPSTSVMAEALNSIPTADVAPVRHGRVETVTDRFMVMHQRCSECDAELEWKAYPNYCPNCGAKLDVE